MNKDSNSTVPSAFVQRMLTGAREHLRPAQLSTIFRSAGIAPNLLRVRMTRVTREQFTRLYAGIAIATDDEMLGLWSRPIRPGTLKYLGLSILDAPSLLVSLYRFTRFWNLLLDDYRLELWRDGDIASIQLIARVASPPIKVFGHELMVKLIHGTASWLAGKTLPVARVGFGFARPEDFSGYSALFPAQVAFNQPHTFIGFSETLLRGRFHRTKGELIQFVKRAPDDWIFLNLDETSLTTRVRSLIGTELKRGPTLAATSNALRMSSRSLSRRLAGEGLTFRSIKDGVKRDIAVDRLVRTQDSIAHIAAHVGFEDLSAFHRAFRSWTGSTPKTYRRQQSLARDLRRSRPEEKP